LGRHGDPEKKTEIFYNTVERKASWFGKKEIMVIGGRRGKWGEYDGMMEK